MVTFIDNSMKLELLNNTKFVLGPYRAKQLGFEHWKKNLRGVITTREPPARQNHMSIGNKLGPCRTSRTDIVQNENHPNTSINGRPTG